MNAQTGLFDEIIVDNFAGGGGASTGIELALGKIVDIAINHDPDAILMHRTNHPYTLHLQASVWDLDPVEVCKGRKVGLAWFSPDCKHFSKAKGAALVDRNIRGLAWIVLRWAGTVRPRVIMLENVEEFLTWCPVRRGKPVKSKIGQTFRKWKKQLEDLGYAVDYRILVAADYGAPTSRKRLVLVARCDGQPIRWPERTHAPRDSAECKSGKCKPWRSAAEIIDWSIPCPSVFDTKAQVLEKYGLTAVRPLADNTMRRVIRGVDKFTIRSGKPFIVPTGYGERKGQAPRVNAHLLTEPVLAPFTVTNTSNSVGASADNPVHTVTTAGNQLLVAPNLIQYHTEQTENVRANGVEQPLQTVDASNRYGLATAHLVEYFSTGRPLPVDEPLHTQTTKDREALSVVHVQKYFGGIIGQEATKPLPTVTSVDHNAVCATHVVKFKGQNLGQHPEQPLQTVTTSSGEFAACHVTVVKYQTGAELGHWERIRGLLNQHCGYTLADDELLLLRIGDNWYFINDIGLRMLTPRELYNAMGFPADYQIDRDYIGHIYGKTKQVARCGNAVCPPMATAVVRVNLPEIAIGVDITTMQQLFRRVTV